MGKLVIYLALNGVPVLTVNLLSGLLLYLATRDDMDRRPGIRFLNAAVQFKEQIGNVPPAEYEMMYYRQLEESAMVA